jgi:hypothetical protein
MFNDKKLMQTVGENIVLLQRVMSLEKENDLLRQK